MIERLENEQQLDPVLIGTSTHLGPWALCSSPSRLIMLASQIQQKLITKGINRSRFFVGVEKEYAKYTFGCKTNFPCEVIAVIDKFTTGRGIGNFRYNPKKIIIVRNLVTQEYDYLDYEMFCSHHTSFGFEFIPVIENAHLIQPREVIQRDVTLLRSPGVTPEGDYIFTTRTKTAFQTHRAVTEDGFLVSDEWCQENKTTGYGEVVVNVPKNRYPRNTYGSKTRYQPFPLPGESIRKDGLLMSLGEYDDILGAIEMSDEEMLEYDYFFDEKYFIESGAENARVVDIDIWCSEGDKVNKIPQFKGDKGTDDVVTRLWKEKVRNLEKIVKTYKEIARSAPRGKTPAISKKFHRLVTDALVNVNGFAEGNSYRFKKSSIPTLYIKISFMYDITPGVGHKLTNLYGMKGVICATKPRAEMPRYKDGTTADLVADGFSIVNRMNPSVFFEHYANYIAEQRVEKVLREWLREDNSRDTYYRCFDLLCKFYAAACPLYLDKINSQNWGYNRIKTHVDTVDKDAIFAYMPQQTPGMGITQMQRIRDAFPEPVEHVTWINDLGYEVTSTDPVMIGEINIMLLEKTGHDWGGVDVSKRQAHGVPTKPSGRDRHNYPYRRIPYRIIGEADIRNHAGIVGGRWAADLLDRANNPLAQEMIWRQVISKENPMALEYSVDRNKIPLGNSLALSYLNNALYTGGAVMSYIDIDNINEEEEVLLRASQYGSRSSEGELDDVDDGPVNFGSDDEGDDD